MCEHGEDYSVLCPVDYDAPEDGLIEILDGKVWPLVVQLNKLYAKTKPRKARKAK